MTATDAFAIFREKFVFFFQGKKLSYVCCVKNCSKALKQIPNKAKMEFGSFSVKHETYFSIDGFSLRGGWWCIVIQYCVLNSPYQINTAGYNL